MESAIDCPRPVPLWRNGIMEKEMQRWYENSRKFSFAIPHHPSHRVMDNTILPCLNAMESGVA
jgi:hypothetical protein